MHPLAIPGNKSGAGSLRAGDSVVYDIDGRSGTLDECLSDGEAYVTWADGTHGTVNWNYLSPAGA